MYDFDPQIRVSYERLRKLLRKRRMSISAFGKRAGISRADLYMMQIDELMSPEGEYNACIYLQLDCCDIRDVEFLHPDNLNADCYFSEEDLAILAAKKSEEKTADEK